MTATDEIKQLHDGGFSPEEIDAWAMTQRKHLSEAGFSQGEIDGYFGQPPFDPTPIKAHVDEAMKTATHPTTEGGQPKPVTNFTDALKAGFGESVLGLLMGKPTEVLAPDAPRSSRIAASVGTLAGDVPAMVGGYLVGGANPITGTAGAFALPAGIRRILMDKYEKGEVAGFGDFWDRFSGAFIDTAKGWITGAATGAVGKAIGLAPIASPTVKAAATVTGEIATMVTVGNALEGKMPEPDDFIDTALALGFVKGSVRIAGKLRTIYAETGVKPDEVVRDIQRDPTILQELASEDVQVPTIYKPQSAKDATPVEPSIPIGDAQKAVLDRLVLKDPATASMTLSDVYTSIVDHLDPVKQKLKAGGKLDLPTHENPLDLERLTNGVAGKATEFLNHGAFDFETYKTQTPGYFKILEPVKKDLDGFRAYMVAKRAIEKEGQGVTTGIPLEEARAVVKEGKAKYEKVHQERIQYRDALLGTLQKSGILSADAVKAMREANRDYVPFYRFFEEDGGRSTGAKGARNPIKKMGGSEKQILDPIISDIKDTFMFVALAEKNAARQAFVKLGPEFAEKQKDPLQATKLTEPEIRKMFDEFLRYRKEVTSSKTESTSTTGGSEAQASKQSKIVVERVREALLARGFQPGEADQMMKRVGEVEASKAGATIEKITKEIEETTYIPELDIRLPNDAATVLRSMQKPLAKDEIAVFDNGKRSVYTLDPKVAEAFNGLDSQTTSLLAKIVYAPASLLRAGVTITPDFIMRNVMRDAVSSFIYAGSNPIKTALGLKSIVTKDTAFHNWMKGGGANATLVAIDRNYLATQIGELNAQTGLMRRAWNVATSPLDILRATSELIENATRIGAVRSELLHAKSKAQIQALSMIAREATVDFARHGKDTKGVSKATAFFNPAIQGIDRFAREAMTNPLGMTAKAVAAVTLPSMLLWYANKDDKEIQDLPRWQKDLFWVTRVPLPDGKSFILRIPKPQEFGIVFGTVPERLLDAFVADNPHALRDIDRSIMDAFTPSLVPTAAVPIIAQFANRDTFRGNPLIPVGVEKLLPEYQYTSSTSELAKAMGQLIGSFPGMEQVAVRNDDVFIGGTARALTSPVLIENYVRNWTGGMGMYLLQLADKGLREAGVLPDPVKPASTLSDIPFVRAFVVRYPSATAQSIQDFYSDYDASKTYYDTIIHLAKEGDPRAMDLIEQHAEDLAQLSGIRDTLTQQSQIIRMIDKHPEMPADEKRQIIDTLYYRMIELAQAGNTALSTIKDTMKK